MGIDRRSWAAKHHLAGTMSRARGRIKGEDRELAGPDAVLKRYPALSGVEAMKALPGAEKHPVHAKPEGLGGRPCDQRTADPSATEFGLDPNGRHPRRELRTFRQIGRDHRHCASEGLVMVGDQREGDRAGRKRLLHPVPKVRQRRSMLLPPGTPDPVRDLVAKRRLPTQVGYGDRYPKCLAKNETARPQASSAASRSCTAARCSLTKAWSAS